MILDLSKIKSTLDLFGRMGTPGNRDISVDDPIWSAKDDFEKKKAVLDDIPGISQCNILEDSVNATIGFEFDFKNIDVLNKAMNVVAEVDSGKAEKVYFVYQKRQITRSPANDFDDLDLSPSEENQDIINILPLFEDMRYVMEYTFPKKVKSVSNEKATLSLDRKTVILNYEILKDYKDFTIENTIRY